MTLLVVYLASCELFRPSVWSMQVLDVASRLRSGSGPIAAYSRWALVII